LKTSPRKSRFVVVLAIAMTLALLYFYVRFPISSGRGHYYFTNYVFVYERQPRQCGFMGCVGPDIFPFARDTEVVGADPISFRFVGSFSPRAGQESTLNDIYRDKNHVIYQGRVVWKSEANDLRLFDGYAKDKSHIYLEGIVLEKLDPATFELLGCGFHRDRNGIYNSYMSFENVIATIDRDTFEVINPMECHFEEPYNAKDKNHRYKSDGVSGFRIIR